MAHLMSYEISSFFNEAFSKYPCPSSDYSSCPFLRKLAYANVSQVNRSIYTVKGCFDSNAYNNSAFLKTKARGYSSLPRWPLLANLEDISSRGDGLDDAVMDDISIDRCLQVLLSRIVVCPRLLLLPLTLMGIDTHQIIRFLSIMYMSFSRYGTVHEMKDSAECNQGPHNRVDREVLCGSFPGDSLWKSFCSGWLVQTQVRDMSLGSKVLIDDNLRHAMEFAEAGMRVLLFDYEKPYPWCKTDVVDGHPLITRVTNRQQVELQLVSLVAS